MPEEPFRPLPDAERRAYLEIMGRYSETARSFGQLSMAALALPVIFLRQILGLDEHARIPVDPLIVTTWIAFLVAILASQLYQYLAVKYLTAHFWREDWKGASQLVRSPGLMYGVMLVSFFAGTLAFVLKCAVHFFTLHS
jgi:uncharacterized membrane protein